MSEESGSREKTGKFSLGSQIKRRKGVRRKSVSDAASLHLEESESEDGLKVARKKDRRRFSLRLGRKGRKKEEDGEESGEEEREELTSSAPVVFDEGKEKEDDEGEKLFLAESLNFTLSSGKADVVPSEDESISTPENDTKGEGGSPAPRFRKKSVDDKGTRRRKKSSDFIKGVRERKEKRTLGSKMKETRKEVLDHVHEVTHHDIPETVVRREHKDEVNCCGTLRVRVVEGKGLGTSVAKVVVKCEGSVYATEEAKGSDPKWPIDSNSKFKVNFSDLAGNVLLFVYDAGRLKADVPRGVAVVPLLSLIKVNPRKDFQGACRWVGVSPLRVAVCPTKEDLEQYEASNCGFLFLEMTLTMHHNWATSLMLFESLPNLPSVKAQCPDKVSSDLPGPAPLNKLKSLASRLHRSVGLPFLARDMLEWPAILLLEPALYFILFLCPTFLLPLVVGLCVIGTAVRSYFHRRKAQDDLLTREELSVGDLPPLKEIRKIPETVLSVAQALEKVVGVAEKAYHLFSFAEPKISAVFFALVLVGSIGVSVICAILSLKTVVFIVLTVLIQKRIFPKIVEAVVGDQVTMIEMHLVQGRDLVAMDMGGTSDPYCVIEDVKGMKGEKMKTPIVFKTLAPVWNSKFVFCLNDQQKTVRVSVWDKDKAAKDDPMGFVEVDVYSFSPQDAIKWLAVKEGTGDVMVELRVIGNTWDQLKNSKFAFWKDWPLVKKIKKMLEGDQISEKPVSKTSKFLTMVAAVHSFSLKNLIERIPSYKEYGVRAMANAANAWAEDQMGLLKHHPRKAKSSGRVRTKKKSKTRHDKEKSL